MIVGGRMLVRGDMTIGDFFAFTLYLGFMVAPVFQLVSIGTQITEAFAGLDRMHEVLEEQPEDVDPERTVALGALKGSLQFKDVCFEYEAGKPVLRAVSLTLFLELSQRWWVLQDRARARSLGLSLPSLSPGWKHLHRWGELVTVRLDSYRSQLGVVLQDNFLFDGTIKENILFGRPTASDEAVVRAARIARVDEFASKTGIRFGHGRR